MTQIESAGLAWISLAMAGRAIFAIALSSTDRASPTARFRIAQYLCGSGSPSSAVFIRCGVGHPAWGIETPLTYAAAAGTLDPTIQLPRVCIAATGCGLMAPRHRPLSRTAPREK